MVARLDSLSDRVAFLRTDVLQRDLRAEASPVRGTLAQEALDATPDKPQALRIAAVLDRVFRGVPVAIRPRELLVGFRAAEGYPEVDDAVRRGSAEYPYMIADFSTLLEQGVEGVIARAEKRLRRLEEANPDQMEGVYFLQAAITSCRAVIAWAERYAAEAERQAADEADAARRAELIEIAARCRRVPARPARGFADAVQSVWFLYVALYLETRAASCLGRVDQYLLPYYRADLASGALTREQAKEWLCCLWVKLYENVFGVIGSHAQTVTLGGLRPDGSSGVNELSALCIEVAQGMGNVGAQVAVRWTRRQDPALTAAALGLAGRGAVMPQLYNDEVYIPSLTRIGVPVKDAREYALFGCHEPVIAGMGYQRPASWPGYVSFYDWLETALGLRSQGMPPVLERIGPPPRNSAELWKGWLAAMRQGVRAAVIRANYGDTIKRELLPRPLLSAFLRDCIGRAADLTAGGARYNMTGFQGCALATTVDSFLAVKTRVFEERKVTMEALLAALQADYRGQEPLRVLLAGGPHYGAGCDEADTLARDMVNAFATEVEKHRNGRGGRFAPGMWSFVQNVYIGARTAASPDGRGAGRPISHSMDPGEGRAVAGPTAVVRAAARIRQKRLSNGGSLLLEFAKSLMAEQAGRGKVQQLCETYLRLGGVELQVSAARIEELEAAQREPDKYRDLVVRVAGYSEFFVRLEPALQAYVIAREKHTVGA